MFGKKKAESQTAEVYSDPYVAPAYQEPVQQYEPAAVESAPAPVERSYPRITETADVSMGAKYHTVAKQDTLYRLARTYYNNASRWRDIYEANRAEIGDPNKIYVGQRLLIP
jgi:nucleoid-associated protein YgaU